MIQATIRTSLRPTLRGVPETSGAAPGPVNTVSPVISNAGVGELGDTLTTTNGTWTTLGTISGYAYQWYRGSFQIAGATSNTYDLVEADDELPIRCKVTAADEFGSRSKLSNSLGPYDLVGEPGAYNDGYLTYGGEVLTYAGDYLTFTS